MIDPPRAFVILTLLCLLQMTQVNGALCTAESTAKAQSWAEPGACAANLVIHANLNAIEFGERLNDAVQRKCRVAGDWRGGRRSILPCQREVLPVHHVHINAKAVEHAGKLDGDVARADCHNPAWRRQILECQHLIRRDCMLLQHQTTAQMSLCKGCCN